MSGRNFSLKEMETWRSKYLRVNVIHAVRKELLSERDGNSSLMDHMPFANGLKSGRNFSLKEMETYAAPSFKTHIPLVRKELLSERDGNKQC